MHLNHNNNVKFEYKVQKKIYLLNTNKKKVGISMYYNVHQNRVEVKKHC